MSGEDPHPPRDEGLVAYLEAIESALRVRRGTEQTLSPRDFSLARGWYESGVPLAAVLVALDRGFETEPALVSLAPLRRRVEDLAAVGPRPGGAHREAERVSLPELAERLATLREGLLALPGRAAAQPLVDLDEIAGLVSVASRPNWDYLRTRLRRIDDLVAEAALEALAPAEADSLRAEAERAAARHRGRVDARALDEALARLVRQRAREILRLPRVGLD